MSRSKYFRKVQDGDPASAQVQSNVESAIASILRNPVLDSRIVSSVSLNAGDNKIEHKLARVPKGWLLVDRSNGSTIYRTSSDDKFLVLNSSVSATVSILIF